MEHSVLPGGIFSPVRTGILGLEMQLPQQQQQQQPHHHHKQNPQNTQNPPHLNQPQMVAFAHHDPQQTQQSTKHGYPYTINSVASKPKQQPSPLSDDDDPGFNTDDTTGDGKKKISQWHRMKWTDNMVRLLILAVYYIGDEVGSEGNDPTTTKKKGGALLQKKGKWKSVSRAMMEKGFYVSPQQCEDKFNDLNKRYKRVNDILGKGTACLVVENQTLLDSMDLSPKTKEEVRKLLNSKHLFFREMCAYHNSCGHNSTGAAPGTNQSAEGVAEASHAQHQQIQQQQQRCLHSSTENAQIMENSGRAEGLKMGKRLRGEEGEEEDDDDDESDEDEDDDEDDEEETEEGNARAQNGHGLEEDDEHDVREPLKRPRKEGTSASIQQLNGEITSLMQDVAKTTWEKSQWIKLKLLHLEEQQVNHQFQAFEIEKQRLKWLKFSSKKEREMDKAKLKNEGRRLENERMMLLVREKEIELHEMQHHHHHQQHSPNKRSDPSSVTA